eukprot:CAMPEP_0203886442 /NCGR_PEP_ID=MMETSP0359-20131031/30256_1 /ASSEMBLY_ACC=CAM_ASM_000338 /TAXON_ID=268821 /ORGANISM="Scrippsiella Hangoei, Strain SHTV-5" /LENGTH=686 /DNA_ID=CAMNT_0050807267 /DNA_START=63 /DNA_END=2120 /DNA_ORIENTATION=-
MDPRDTTYKPVRHLEAAAPALEGASPRSVARGRLLWASRHGAGAVFGVVGVRAIHRSDEPVALLGPSPPSCSSSSSPPAVTSSSSTACSSPSASALRLAGSEVSVKSMPPALVTEMLYGGKALYEALVDEFTDAEGWVYGRSVQRLSAPRLGGRAAARLTDRVRRRRWRRREAPLSGDIGPGLAASKGKLHRSHSTADHLISDYEEDMGRIFKSMKGAASAVIGKRKHGGLPLDPWAHLMCLAKERHDYKVLCQSLPVWDDRGVLESLCVAVLYARAAYGFVARMGYFDSLASGALIFSVQKAYFDLADHPDVASHRRSFLDMMQLRPEDLICDMWMAGAMCPVVAMARDHDMQWLVVAIRGTLSFKDILTDMACKSVPFLEGQAHEGFVVATERLVKELRAKLPDEVARYPGYRVVLCGHSMGAAIAAMAAAVLRAEDDWAAGCVAYGFGTPAVFSRCIGDRLAAEGAVYTVVNGRDWVPRTSLSNTHRLLDDVVSKGILRSAIRSTQRLGRGCSAFWGGIEEGCEVSAAVVERSATPSEHDDESEMVPPGHILQIATGISTSSCTAPPLLRARNTDYRGAMAVFPDVEAHLPIGYVRGLLANLAAALASPCPADLFPFENAELHLGGRPWSPNCDLTSSAASADEEGADSVENRGGLAALRRLALPLVPDEVLAEDLPVWPDGG